MRMIYMKKIADGTHWEVGKSEPQMGIEPTILRNPFETGHFTSWKERERLKCLKMKNARAKRAKLLFFILKYANS